MNYTDKSERHILNWLKDHLSEERLLHSIGAAQSAARLAKKFNQDEKKAYTAGLLHDCAKCLKKEDMLKIAVKLGLDKSELSNFKLIHAPVSAYIAESEFGVKDKEILSSIRWHTLGRMNMSDFEKVVFLADKIELNTRDLNYRERVLCVLEEENGLNKALLICYEETIKSLIKRDMEICQTTIDIYNSMLKEYSRHCET
ncbi:MAG: bis(5'-nucleosyl)-tetraphosphatase (symmetrical) YqeK [Candidatus Gastranaerophilaceae bacterium]